MQDIMLPSKEFTKLRNYYVIVVLDLFVRIFKNICDVLKIFPTNIGEKNTVVFIGAQHIGDILFTTPAIRFLKENRPQIKIIVILAQSELIGINDNKNIYRTVDFEINWFSNKKAMFGDLKTFVRLIKLLKRLNPEAVVNYSSSSYHREHLAMWIAGVPERIGFSHKGFGSLLTVHKIFKLEEVIPKKILALVGYWLDKDTTNYSLKPDYFVSQEVMIQATKLLDSIRVPERKIIIGISPGANHNFLWPVNHYIQLCTNLYNKHKVTILFLGTKSARDIYNEIQSKLEFKTYSLIGMTNIKELAALMKKLDLFITVDSGPRHIANALGVRTIVLCNGASPYHGFTKYADSESVLINYVPCSPCGSKICKIGTLDCMRGITPTRVLEEINKIIATV